MIASAFISLTFGHIAFIIFGAVLGIACFGGALLAVDSKYGPVPFLGFGLFFIIGCCIVFPHMSTVNHRHSVQAHADFQHEYGARVIDMSVSEHWAVVQVPGCAANIKYDMRRIRGHYWFAAGEQKHDEAGNSYTEYHPMPLRSLLDTCSRT